MTPTLNLKCSGTCSYGIYLVHCLYEADWQIKDACTVTFQRPFIDMTCLELNQPLMILKWTILSASQIKCIFFLRLNDNDVETFSMLKYGRNEKSDVLRFDWSKTTKTVLGHHYFHYESPSIKFCPCDFLTNFLAKGLFLTSTTQTLPTFNGGNCSFAGFWYSVANF